MAPDPEDMPPAPRLTPVGPVIRAQDAAMWAEAADALAETRRYADRMRAWARAASERERERGYAEGWSAGAEAASRCIAATAARTERYLRDLERDLPRLVIELLERVLGAFDPGEVLSRAVAHAVGKLSAGSEIRVRVSPERADDLRRALSDGPAHGGTLVRVDADPGLSPGTCILQSEFGNVELGIEAQLRALREGLESVWGEEPGHPVPRQDTAP